MYHFLRERFTLKILVVYGVNRVDIRQVIHIKHTHIIKLEKRQGMKIHSCITGLLVSVFSLTATTATLEAAPPKAVKIQGDSLPERWQYMSDFSMTVPDQDSWWKEFNDPILDSLITRSVDANYNVAQAASRMAQARQVVNQARSAYMPTLNFSGGWNKSRQSGAMSVPIQAASDASYFSAGVDMSWQIDVFGKITAGVKEKKAAWRATRAQYAGVMMSLCGDVATAYFNLRMVQSELDVAERHASSQRRVLEITEARHEAGLASMLDVAQARTILYSTEATIPQLQAQVNSYLNSLSVLTGTMPGTMSDSVMTSHPLPDYHRIVAVGVPLDILRRRPDISEAEENLASAAASLGIAKKDFLPTLSLQGSIGTSAHRAGDLFKNQSFTYTIAPTLSWTIFSGLSRKYAVAAARQQMEMMIDSYNQTVLSAVQETDNAMAAYHSALEQIDALEKVVDASSKSFDLSIDLYKKGLSSFTNVADAQINLLTYTNSLLVAKCNALISLVNLYEALGGGWNGETLDFTDSL